MERCETAAAVLCLAILSAEDIRSGMLPLWQLGVLAGAGAAAAALRNGIQMWRYAADLLPAALAWAVGMLTGGGVGSGDVLCLAGLGLLQGGGACGRIGLTGLLLCAPVCAVLLMRRRRGRHDMRRTPEVPFVPFLLASEIIYILMEEL